MFKLIFSQMHDNNIFTQYGLQPVAEDYFEVQDNCFCITDGVTRDNILGNAVKYPQTKQEAEEWVKNYPNPSGAMKAANIICSSFMKDINRLDDSEINEHIIKDIMKKANKELNKINDGRDIDYVKEDYYCCVSVGGRIVEDYLYCFSIGDCHIDLLDNEYNKVFTTINNHKPFEEYERENTILKGYTWQDAEYRKIVRKEYRNNPNKKCNGRDVSFGVLSGEVSAEYYINTYKIDLKNVKYICAYSDGCEPIFESKEKIKNIIDKPEKFADEGKERTLIIYEKYD